MTLTTEAITCIFGWVLPPDRDNLLEALPAWKKGGEKLIVWQRLVRNFFDRQLSASDAQKFIEARFPTGWAKKLEVPFYGSPKLPVLKALRGTPELVLTMGDGEGKVAMFNCGLNQRSFSLDCEERDLRVEAMGGWSAWFQAWDDGSITRCAPSGVAELLIGGIETPIDQIGEFPGCTDALGVGEGQLLWLPPADGEVRNLPEINLPKRFALAHIPGHILIGMARGTQIVKCGEECKAKYQLWNEGAYARVAFIHHKKGFERVTAEGSTVILHTEDEVTVELDKSFPTDFIQTSSLIRGKVLVASEGGQLAMVDVARRKQLWQWKGCGSPIKKLQVLKRHGQPILLVQTGKQLGVMDVRFGTTLRVFSSFTFTASNDQIALAPLTKKHRVEVY